MGIWEAGYSREAEAAKRELWAPTLGQLAGAAEEPPSIAAMQYGCRICGKTEGPRNCRVGGLGIMFEWQPDKNYKVIN